jgi:dihydropteroate synthase
MRLGVSLSPLKARIFDAIRRASPAGVPGELLIEDLGLPITRKTLKAHVWQINDRLSENGYRINGRGGYRLEKDHAHKEHV